mgnify:FL=1
MNISWDVPWRQLSKEEKLKRRLWVSIYAPKDKEIQLMMRLLCKQDPLFFIEMFCFTFDPQKTPSKMPFLLYPFQINLVDWLENKLKTQTSGIIEKSRQQGVTHVSMAFLLYHWIFSEEFGGLVGSRTETQVDKRGKSDTLFEKLDFNLKYLPQYILPRGFDYPKDRRHLILVNKRKNNVIYGESQNKNFGRGGTLSIALMDECASWESLYDSYTSVSEATKVRILISTPKSYGYFKTLRFSKQLDVLTLHWRLHPEKTEEWYQLQLATKSKEQVAQEIDIDYSVTGQGKVYEEANSVPIGNYPYDPTLPLYTATDYGYTDNTAIIWLQTNLDKSKVFVIDSYTNSQHTIDYYVPFYTGRIPLDNKYTYTKHELDKIKEHVKWKRARHFGDPAGKAKTVTSNRSAIRILSQNGVFVFTNDQARKFPPRRDATKMLLRVLYVNRGNEYFLDCIKDARYPEIKQESQRTAGITKPTHDFTSHYRTALEYFAVNIGIKRAKPRTVNYLKKIKVSEDEKEDFKTEKKQIERKKRVVRWAMTGY